jgi:integrase
VPTIKLTTPFIKSAQHVPDPEHPGRDRTIWWSASMPGFGYCVKASGATSYCYQYRTPEGISRRASTRGDLTLKAATKWAKGIMGAVAKDHDPVQQKRLARKAARAAVKDTFGKVADRYLKAGTYDKAGARLRTVAEYERIVNVYLKPKFGTRPIAGIKRGEIGRHLDHIATEHGPVMADHTLKVLRRIMTWHATRDDDFALPLVAGMRRTSIRDRARARTLNDDEIRALWAAAEALGTPYSRMLQFVLLTATRLREAAQASRSEFAGDSWTIPAARFKGKRDFLVPLSKAAQDVLAKAPVVGDGRWVFTHDGETALNSFSKGKREVDKAMLEELRKVDPEAELPRWTTHDLRRSARSLMSRAGVDPDHAERALGHVVGGVRGVYDRYEFKAEKAAAFEKLAQIVGTVLDPQSNVVALRA